MSLRRCAQPTSASHILFKFASSLAPAATRSPTTHPTLCLRCFAHQYPSRRKVSTTTEYRPHTLDPVPPPPRNTNIPDTSIAGVLPQKEAQHDTTRKRQGNSSTLTIPETAAQIPHPVTPTPKRRRPLRPKKAAMTVTPTAVSQLHNLLSLPEPKMIRVGVKNRGCSGLAYHLEYVDQPGKFDEVVEECGVKVLIDSKALFSIIGSEMDWVEDKLNARFVFRNPNIKEQCGCGESFMV